MKEIVEVKSFIQTLAQSLSPLRIRRTQPKELPPLRMDRIHCGSLSRFMPMHQASRNSVAARTSLEASKGSEQVRHKIPPCARNRN